MVDMGMGQDHRRKSAGFEGERFAIECLDRTGSLKQPAIDKDTVPANANFHARAGDRACRSMEGDGCMRCHFIPSHAALFVTVRPERRTIANVVAERDAHRQSEEYK